MLENATSCMNECTQSYYTSFDIVTHRYIKFILTGFISFHPPQLLSK